MRKYLDFRPDDESVIVNRMYHFLFRQLSTEFPLVEKENVSPKGMFSQEEKTQITSPQRHREEFTDQASFQSRKELSACANEAIPETRVLSSGKQSHSVFLGIGLVLLCGALLIAWLFAF